jgi:DNA-binding GntR family transcriptional regulator
MQETRTDIAHQYLYDSIVNGQIPLGSPIYEVQVANELKISRSPVREALKKLEAEGLVISHNGRGSFAIQISQQDLEEIFELRMLFELTSLKKASNRLDLEFWEDIEKHIEALSDSSSRDDFYRLDKRLHRTIINCGGNSRLSIFYHRLETQIDMIRRISAQSPSHFANSKRYHLQIIRDMKNNDLNQAAKHLEEHINDVRDNTINIFLLGTNRAGGF